MRGVQYDCCDWPEDGLGVLDKRHTRATIYSSIRLLHTVSLGHRLLFTTVQNKSYAIIEQQIADGGNFPRCIIIQSVHVLLRYNERGNFPRFAFPRSSTSSEPASLPACLTQCCPLTINEADQSMQRQSAEEQPCNQDNVCRYVSFFLFLFYSTIMPVHK